LHPISTVYAGPMLWPLDQAAEVLRWYRDYIIDAPEEMNGWFAFLTVPPAPPFPEHLHLKKMCGVLWCYTGPLEQAVDVFKPNCSSRGKIACATLLTLVVIALHLHIKMTLLLRSFRFVTMKSSWDSCPPHFQSF
ncbi:MAG: hypothetical protein K8J31_26395, partial [Anaerolineae bacterium]|nr:hypothetical protein [Anaerolineae bacterium]